MGQGQLPPQICSLPPPYSTSPPQKKWLDTYLRDSISLHSFLFQLSATKNSLTSLFCLLHATSICLQHPSLEKHSPSHQPHWPIFAQSICKLTFKLHKHSVKLQFVCTDSTAVYCYGLQSSVSVFSLWSFSFILQIHSTRFPVTFP